MSKETILRGLIIAILIYYLMKGILCLILWQVTEKMEEKGKERKEKANREREERLKAKKEREEKEKEERKIQPFDLYKFK